MVAEATKRVNAVNGQQSHEVIRAACEGVGVKTVAAALRLSVGLIYKWGEPYGSIDDSGTLNPLDRVLALHRVTGDPLLLRYLCNAAGGFFAENPTTLAPEAVERSLVSQTRCIVREFAELLDTATDCIETTPGVCGAEASEIRRQWEDLKQIGESFVVSCERGTYASVEGRA